MDRQQLVRKNKTISQMINIYETWKYHPLFSQWSMASLFHALPDLLDVDKMPFDRAH
jgi:hypothetical protein